jgi:hypothetical protein
MNYPNLTLTIKNNIPSLEMQKSEDDVTQILVGVAGLDTLMMKAADIVGYAHQDDIEALMKFQHDGEWEFWQFSEIDASKQDFKVDYLLDEVAVATEAFSIPAEAASPELKQQLKEYWQADMLASFLEEIYTVLVAQIFFAAAELAIPTIVLNDHRKEPRLREKMSKELAVVPELEFLVTD